MGFRADRVKELDCPECGQTIDTSSDKPMRPRNCPHCGAEVMVPASFDHFLVYQRMGKGSFGHVFRAVDTRLDREVAIKVLVGDDDTDDEELAREIITEARTLASLNHQHIVKIHTLGEHRDQHYIVMELLDGGTGKAYLSKCPDEQKVLDFAIGIVEGLRAAQRVGLVHMDVKPGNVLFSKDGHAKLIDFGTAQHEKKHNKDKGIVGTPYYIAPEVARGHAPNFKSDLYSLGASLFHILAGRPPFVHASVADTIKARLKQPAPYLHDIKPSVSIPMSDVVAKMLATRPADRYDSYDEALDALRQAKSAIASGAHVSEDAAEAYDELAALSQATGGEQAPARPEEPTIPAAASARRLPTGTATMRSSTARSSTARSAATAVRTRKSKAPLVTAVAMGLGIIIAIVLIAVGGGGEEDAGRDASRSPTASAANVSPRDTPPIDVSPQPLPEPEVTPAPPTVVEIKPRTDGLMAHWSFNNHARDNTLNSLNADAKGTVTYVDGLFYKSARFAGGSEDYIAMPDEAIRPEAGAIALWFNVETPGEAMLVSTDGAPTSYDVSIAADGNLSGKLGGAVISGSAAPVAPGAWTHVALNWTSNGKGELYVNGELVGAVDVDELAEPTNATLGACDRGQSRRFRGLMDDVRVYGQTLSGADVAKLVKSGRDELEPPSKPDPAETPDPPGGLVAHFPLDGSTGDLVNRERPNHVNGKTQFVDDGPVGRAFRFDGKARIQIGSNTLRFTDTLSVAVWVRLAKQQQGSFPTIIAKGDNTWRLALEDREYGRYHFAIDGGQSLRKVTSKGGGYNDDAWHHVAATYDGRTIRLYIDGKLENTIEFGGSRNVPHDDHPIWIGDNSERAGRFIRGDMADLRLYKRVVTPAEVAELAASGKAIARVATPTSAPSNATPAPSKPVAKEPAPYPDDPAATPVKDTRNLRVASPGPVKVERWNNINSGKVADLLKKIEGGAGPDETGQVGKLDYSGKGDRFGLRITGYLLPPATGNYKFFVSADDQAMMRLSKDADPRNIAKIADKGKDSGEIALEKGKAYYFELYHTEGVGSQYVRAEWRRPDGTKEVITKDHLANQLNDLAADVVGFVALTPAKAQADKEADLQIEQGGAILASGSNAPQTYVITLETDLIHISALQLEAVPFESSISGNPGPGRYAGKFAIAEMDVTVAPKSNPKKAVPVKFKKLVGYDEDRGTLKEMFDGDPNTYWAIERRRGVTTTATLIPVHPVGYPGGTIITIKLDHKLNLGRFRINATTAHEPESVVQPLESGPADN